MTGVEPAATAPRQHWLWVQLGIAVAAQLGYLIASIWRTTLRMPLLVVFVIWVMLLYSSARGLHPSRGRTLAWSAAAAAGLTALAWGFWWRTA